MAISELRSIWNHFLAHFGLNVSDIISRIIQFVENRSVCWFFLQSDILNILTAPQFMSEDSPAFVCNQGCNCFALFLNAFLLLNAHCNQDCNCFALCLNTLLLLCATRVVTALHYVWTLSCCLVSLPSYSAFVGTDNQSVIRLLLLIWFPAI